VGGIDAVDGVEARRLVQRVYETSPDIIGKLKKALQPPR